MRVFVKAKSGAKKEKIEAPAPELWDKAEKEKIALSVWVKEPPIQGKANLAIIKALSEYFQISPSQINLVSGFSSKNKVFDIEGL